MASQWKLSFVLFCLLRCAVHCAEVAGIPLPDEDDVLVQILLDEVIPLEERTELINETLVHIYPPTLPAEERSRGLLKIVKNTVAPSELRYLAAATMVENGLIPPDLGGYLVEECRSDKGDPEWLSYCLRLFDAVYPHVDSTMRNEIVGLLVGAASREGGELAGTSLLALWRIAGHDDAVLPALRTLTRALLSVKGSDEELMIAAFQVAADLRDTEAVPIARRVAFSNQYGIRLRLAGVNVILGLGDEDLRQAVTELGADAVIGRAVTAILKNHRY